MYIPAHYQCTIFHSTNYKRKDCKTCAYTHISVHRLSIAGGVGMLHWLFGKPVGVTLGKWVCFVHLFVVGVPCGCVLVW